MATSSQHGLTDSVRAYRLNSEIILNLQLSLEKIENENEVG